LPYIVRSAPDARRDERHVDERRGRDRAQLGLDGLAGAWVDLVVGVVLAHVIVPTLTLTATGATPVPSVLVIVPLGWVLGVAACLAAVPVLAAALATVRQPDPAAELRAAEAMA